METRQEGFAAIPTWMVRDSGVPLMQLGVFASLASRSGLGAIFPSQETIAAELGISVRSVRNALAALEDRGVLERYSRRGKGDGRGKATGRSDGYVLHPNGPPALADEEPASGAGRFEGPANAGVGTGKIAHVVPLIEVDRAEVDKASAKSPSDDVLRVCELLAERARANGHEPKVGPTWHAAAGRLLAKYDVRLVAAVILWATADSFWLSHVRTMVYLERKFTTLASQAKVSQAKASGGDARAAAESLAARLEQAS